MEPNNQNQQPDYSFITGQPDSFQPKKRNNKIIILGVSVVFLLLVTIVVTIANKTNNSVKNTSVATGQDLVEEFVAGRYDNVVTNLSDSAGGEKTNETRVKVMEVMFKKYDNTKCTQLSPVDKANVITISCPAREGKGSVAFNFGKIKSSGSQIDGYSVTFNEI